MLVAGLFILQAGESGARLQVGPEHVGGRWKLAELVIAYGGGAATPTSPGEAGTQSPFGGHAGPAAQGSLGRGAESPLRAEVRVWGMQHPRGQVRSCRETQE